MAENLPNHLAPSELGTKQYWDEAYVRELNNHSASPNDEGTVWFSDSGAEEKVLVFLDDCADEAQLFKNDNDDCKASTFLDLGTGNGHFLFALRDEGWEGEMVGVDYSAASVKLARKIVETRLSSKIDGLEDFSIPSVRFEEFDILDSSAEIPGGPFDVVLDKGTFDAISLSEETDADGRRICEAYCERVLPFVRRDGLFIITSCNWTEEELRKWFEKDGEGTRGGSFMCCDKVKYPTFTFGGKSGSSIVTLCFRKIGRK